MDGLEHPAAAALLVAALLVLPGCAGGPGDALTTDPRTQTTTDLPTSQTDGAEPLATSAIETAVVDSSPGGGAVIEGGIAAPAAAPDSVTTRYVTVVASASAADRFDHDGLSANASALVRTTSFEDSYLVVIQSFPESSHPDYRLESALRTTGGLYLDVNDSSDGGTADITVETMILRVPGEPPDIVTVTTEAGSTWQSTAGVVTATAQPTTAPPGDQLPFVSEDPAENVEDPRDIVLENRGTGTNGYTLQVEYLAVPDCREATPPCDVPAREVAVLSDTRKLPPNATHRYADVAGRLGDYTVSVRADLPGSGGSREAVLAGTNWDVDAAAPDVHVLITDEAVRFLAPGDSGEEPTATTAGARTETATPQTTPA